MAFGPSVYAEINVMGVTRMLYRLEAKARGWVLADALTETAEKVQKNETEVMKKRFDRPTAFTLNSLYVKRATEKNQTARVYFKDQATKGTPAAKYLQSEVHGGARHQKRMEVALTHYGMLARTGFAVPASGAKLDAYGNVSKGEVQRIMSALRLFSEVGFSANKTMSRRSSKKNNDIFVAEIDGQRAIWQRQKFAMGEGVRPLFWLVSGAPHYRVRLPFQKIADNSVKANYERIFNARLARAVREAE